jgi:hypothetical protein
MRFKKTGGIFLIIVIVTLFCMIGNAEAQCTGGYRGYGPVGPGVVITGTNGDWSGNMVPYNLWAGTMGTNCDGVKGSNVYANVAVSNLYDFIGFTVDSWSSSENICPSGTCEHALTVAGTYMERPGYYRYHYCYSFQPGALSAYDYDCDGRFDNEDPNPGTPDPKINAEKGFPGCNASTGTK